MTPSASNEEIVRAYFAAIQESPTSVVAFYHPDAVQEEFPNRFLPQGARRGISDLEEAARRGSEVMASQRFEILSLFADSDTVVVEAMWTGTLGVALGEDTPAGTVMTARFAQFFQFEEGKIVSQRNYDCFYPWENSP